MPDSTPQNVAARSDILFFLLALQKLLLFPMFQVSDYEMKLMNLDQEHLGIPETGMSVVHIHIISFHLCNTHTVLAFILECKLFFLI